MYNALQHLEYNILSFTKEYLCVHANGFEYTMQKWFQYHFKITLSLSMNYIICRCYHNMLVAIELMTNCIEVEWKSQIDGLIIFTLWNLMGVGIISMLNLM
jgi:hypothetical protein